jgi:hypothetical protein
MSNRDLDRAVAERLGWHDFIRPGIPTYSTLGPDYAVPPGVDLTPSRGYERIPRFSTDVAAAFTVVEACWQRGISMWIGTNWPTGASRERWAVQWQPVGQNAHAWAYGETAAEAICHAALDALKDIETEEA